MAGNPAIPPINPALAQQLGMGNPFMPPPPPPTTPSLGFQNWASDPQNAAKVSHAMVPPDAPLQPNAGQQSASAVPPEISAPLQMPASAMPPIPTTAPPMVMNGHNLGTDQAELQRLQQTGPGVNQIQNPIGRGFAKAGDIALSVLAPNIATLVPGTTMHNLVLQRQTQNRIGVDEGAINQDQDQTIRALQIRNLQNPPDRYQPLQTDTGIMAFDPSKGTAQPVSDAQGNALQPPSKPAQPHYTTTEDGKVVAITMDDAGKPQAQVVYQGDPKQQLSVQDLQVQGRPHRVIVDLKSGQTIKDLGESGIKPPTVNVNAAVPGKDIPLIDQKKEPNRFKIAQDLAYGKLTMQGFRSLYAYSRDTNAKQALYATAQSLNPNFNPAAFEMGFTFAKNPKVQQQLSSLDNVIQAAPDLVKISDDASRTGVKALNSIVQKGGIQLGDKRYSNFHTAQIAFADELSGALGYGSATDMSREMGFNMTDEHLSPDAFSSAVRDVVLPFINRKRATMLNQMGVYGQEGMNPAASAPVPGGNPMQPPTSGGNSAKPDYVYVPGKGLVKQ